jgi:citrate lyase beta subunit
VIPKVEDPADRRELEDLCRQVREAMASGDKARMETTNGVLNDKLLNYAYLL